MGACLSLQKSGHLLAKLPWMFSLAYAFNAERGCTGTLSDSFNSIMRSVHIIFLCSLDGSKCYLCPIGATCEQTAGSGISYGVTIPSRQTGYYLYESRNSYLADSCNNPSSWSSDDPCRHGRNYSSMSERLLNCSASASFDAFWSRKRVFACLAEKEYYNCDVRLNSARQSQNSIANVEYSHVGPSCVR